MSIEKLTAHFENHKQRGGGGKKKLTYVAIDQMLDRANEVYGDKWNSELLHINTEGRETTIAISISVPNSEGGMTTRVGVGGSSMSDVDDRLKTALAEALKKGWNQYGMGLYLWKEENLDAIAETEFKGNAPSTPNTPTEDGSLKHKKETLVDHWKSVYPGENPTAEELQRYYDTKDFNDEGVVDGLLKNHNLAG